MRRALIAALALLLPFAAASQEIIPAPASSSAVTAVTATGGTTSRSLADHFADRRNVSDFGAKSNAVSGTDGTVAAGTPNFCSAATTFTAGDVGKAIILDGSGTADVDQTGTISAFVSQHCVTLSFNTVAATPWQNLLRMQTVQTAQSGAGSYAPNDTLTVSGGTTITTPAVLKVMTTQLVSATVNAAGTGGTNGACTLTGTTGTAAMGRTTFQIAATVTANAISALGTVTTPGVYTTNPTSLTAEPVTGCGALAGATLTLKMGVQQAVVTTAGHYGAFAANPVATTTSGSGTGATLNLWTGNVGGLFTYGTDDTTAVNNAIAAQMTAGGGDIGFPVGTTLMLGAFQFANTGAVQPTQQPIRLTGTGGNATGYELQGACRTAGTGCVATLNSGSIIDNRFGGDAGTHVAKIDTRGAGTLEIDHVTLRDGGTGNFPFIFTTNTTLKIHDASLSGNPTCYQVTCTQDMIQLGTILPPVGGFWTNLSTAPFQGYGTTINDNYFDHCEVAVAFGASANVANLSNNRVAWTCGSPNLTTGAAFLFAGVGLGAIGNIITGGYVEMGGYAYAANMTSNGGGNSLNQFLGVGLQDELPGAPTLGMVLYDVNANNNTIIVGLANSTFRGVVRNGAGTFNGVVNGAGNTSSNLVGDTNIENGHLVTTASAAISAPSGTNPISALQVGDGTTKKAISISAGNTGTAGGPSLGFWFNNQQRGGVGGTSSLLGGAYDGSVMLEGFDGVKFATSNVVAGSIDTLGHWSLGRVGLPTIASGDCGAGTNGTVVANSNDMSMRIIIGAAATTTCKVTFANQFGSAPRTCNFSPYTAASAGAGVVPWMSAPTSTDFTLTGTALASTTWGVQCQ